MSNGMGPNDMEAERFHQDTWRKVLVGVRYDIENKTHELRVRDADRNRTEEPWRVPSRNIRAVIRFKLPQKSLRNAMFKSKSAFLIIEAESIDKGQFNHIIIRPTNKTHRDKDFPELLKCISIRSYDLKSVEDESEWVLQLTVNSCALFKKPLSNYQGDVIDMIGSLSDVIFSQESCEIIISGKQLVLKKCGKLFGEYTVMSDLSDLERYSKTRKSKRPNDPLPQPPDHPMIVPRCGEPPPFLHTPPFFLEQYVPPDNANTIVPTDNAVRIDSEIYGDPQQFKEAGINVDSEFIQRSFDQKRKLLRSKPSYRMTEFLKSVYDKPQYEKLMTEPLGKEALYDIPVKDDQYATEDDSIEYTLYEILKRLRATRCCFPSTCPFGLTPEERRKFCLRLEFIDSDVINGGWKSFAELAVQLNNDDLTMIDEFCVRHTIPPVEVVLIHWHELHQIRSKKSKLEATKKSILHVLKELNRESLIHDLNWLTL